MGISRDGGYSASVAAFVAVGDFRLRLAKTNGVAFVLAEPCSVTVSPQTDAELIIIIDGNRAAKRITLTEGMVPGKQTVKYEEAVPF